MAGYKIGSQAWYDASRKRLVQISKKLRSPETSQEDKNKLYHEQIDIIDSLVEHTNEKLVNNPIV